METQKYYEQDKNVFNVHFPNKPGYSNAEIVNIFSEFGDVVGVTKAGDEYGFRFVRYRHEEEVQRCVEGLKNHPKIRLLPKKSKLNNNNNNDQQQNGQRRNWTNRQESRETTGPWTSWVQKKSDDGEKFQQNNGQRTESRDHNNRRFNDAVPIDKSKWCSEDGNSQRTNLNVAISMTNGEAEQSRERETHTEKLQAAQVTIVDTFEPANSSMQREVTIDPDKNFHSGTLNITPAVSVKSTSRTSQLQIGTEDTAVSLDTGSFAKMINVAPVVLGNTLPKLVEKNNEEEITTEMQNPQILTVAKQNTVDAEAVVVGNVHREYGVHYILHLFQKHNPLCVSPMKIIAKQGLRYCIVYLQSHLQACDIEEEFDNYNLDGKNIIVMRARRLAQLDELI